MAEAPQVLSGLRIKSSRLILQSPHVHPAEQTQVSSGQVPPLSKAHSSLPQPLPPATGGHGDSQGLPAAVWQYAQSQPSDFTPVSSPGKTNPPTSNTQSGGKLRATYARARERVLVTNPASVAPDGLVSGAVTPSSSFIMAQTYVDGSSVRLGLSSRGVSREVDSELCDMRAHVRELCSDLPPKILRYFES